VFLVGLDDFEGTEARALPIPAARKAGLSLYFEAAGLDLTLGWDGTQIDERSMRALLDDLERIAAAVAADPSLRLSALPLG
jgi:hypothetical protein